MIFSLAIVVGGIGFAIWFMRDANAKRDERKQEQTAKDQIAANLASGLQPGDTPLPAQVIEILNGGDFADNAKHVDRVFRDAFKISFPVHGMARAILDAMEAAGWREGSRGQVVDQLKDRRMVSEGDAERMKAIWRAALPGGYGVA